MMTAYFPWLAIWNTYDEYNQGKILYHWPGWLLSRSAEPDAMRDNLDEFRPGMTSTYHWRVRPVKLERAS